MQNVETISHDLNELQALYRRLSLATSAEEKRLLTGQFLLHPAFQRRLRGACGAVMRRWAARPDLRGDVLQEATLQVVEHFRHFPSACADLGGDTFGGWCWTICYRACQKAWGKSRPLWFRSIRLVEQETLAAMPDRVQAPHFRESLIVILNQLPNGIIRGVLVDWAAGVAATETACRYSLSPQSVTRLRQRGLTLLRHAGTEMNESDAG